MKKEDLFSVEISQAMLSEAIALAELTRVHRTKASPFDTVTGILGEFAFAQWFYGNWQHNRVGQNKGEFDFPGIEIKTSAFPFNTKLNLLVRQDYAKKRKPDFYVQIIIDLESTKEKKIAPGTKMYLCGYAHGQEVVQAPLRDFGSKFGGEGGYKCHYVPIASLNSMQLFKKEYQLKCGV